MKASTTFLGTRYDIRHGLSVYLAARGENLIPSTITAATAIKPHQEYRIGDLVNYMTGQQPAPTGLWLLQEQGATRSDLSPILRKLLVKPLVKAQAWRNATAPFETVVYIERDIMSRSSAVHIDSDVLSTIASLGSKLSINV